jgi:hypothetical protein
MGGTGYHHVKQNKPDSERQILHAYRTCGIWIFLKKNYGGRRKSGPGKGGAENIIWRYKYNESTFYAYVKMLK